MSTALNESTAPSRLGRVLIVWVAPVGLPLAFLGLFAGYGLARFGSLPAAFAYANGERILVDAHTKSLGDVPARTTRTLAYTLRNLTDHEVVIQGAKTSCGCAVVTSVPCAVKPGGSHIIGLRVKSSPKRERLEGNFHLYTDNSDTPEIVLGFTGRVVVPRAARTPEESP